MNFAGEPSIPQACHLRDVVVAGHLGNTVLAAEALSDPEPAVRAAALGAMERLGALQSQQLLSAMSDPSPQVRRRAVELCVFHHEVDPSPALGDEDPLVVEVAAFALGEQERSASVALLCEVASKHADPLCRESAVAALGAIGDPAGLDCVLGALEDRPAVRRRAVIALAAFEGDRVDQALRRSLEDRDWQVRQAAEDLLSPPQ